MKRQWQNEEGPDQSEESNMTQAGEAQYVFLVVLARYVRQVADTVEAGGREQGAHVTVLMYGLTSKLAEGFLFLKIQGDRDYFAWLQNQVEGVVDFVAFALKPQEDPMLAAYTQRNDIDEPQH